MISLEGWIVFVQVAFSILGFWDLVVFQIYSHDLRIAHLMHSLLPALSRIHIKNEVSL
jgi:hypothetical protein